MMTVVIVVMIMMIYFFINQMVPMGDGKLGGDNCQRANISKCMYVR